MELARRRPRSPSSRIANATVTALAKFAICPRQYYLGEYLGFEGRPRKPAESGGEVGGLSAGEFGTQVHALLAGSRCAEPDAEALRLAETSSARVRWAAAWRAPPASSGNSIF